MCKSDESKYIINTQIDRYTEVHLTKIIFLSRKSPIIDPSSTSPVNTLLYNYYITIRHSE